MDRGYTSTTKMARGEMAQNESLRLNSQNRSRSRSYSSLNMPRTLPRCTGSHTNASSKITEIRMETDTPRRDSNISKTPPDGGNQFDSTKGLESYLLRPKCREHDIKIMVTVTATITVTVMATLAATITPVILLSSNSMCYHQRINIQTR